MDPQPTKSKVSIALSVEVSKLIIALSKDLTIAAVLLNLIADEKSDKVMSVLSQWSVKQDTRDLVIAPLTKIIEICKHNDDAKDFIKQEASHLLSMQARKDEITGVPSKFAH